MSEALLSDAELLPWKPTEVLHGGLRCTPYRRENVTALQSLPAVQPGELWYVQFPSAQAALAPLEYGALVTANVVIYDGALAPVVAGSLPLGGYAELAPPRGRAIERCLHFARDGWSVARLVDPQNDWGDDLRGLLTGLPRASASTVLPASIIVNAAGRYTRIEAKVCELGDVAGSLGLEQAITMTIVFDGSGAGTAPRFVVASANGLAG